MVALDSRTANNIRFEEWWSKLKGDWKEAHRDEFQRAFQWIRRACPDSIDGLWAVDLLASLQLDSKTLLAAMLHQLISEGHVEVEAIKRAFGEEVALLVDGVTRLDIIAELHKQSEHSQQQLESLRKMLIAMAEDIRIVLIKLAVQLVQMRHLDNQSAEERQRIALETRNIFAPLANRLGMGRIKWELEDLAMRHLEPTVYRSLAKALDERRSEREEYLQGAMSELRQALFETGIAAEVSGRVKHLYSIWRKMQQKRLSFEQLFDIRAMRVMVDSIADCYAALGVAHSTWSYVAKEFDDYIANPKDNGYQSLHTAVVGPQGKVIEIQIRTHAMHRSAEFGVAAHWRYKEGKQGPGMSYERQIEWLRNMLERDEESGDALEVLDRFRNEAFRDRVYVITPKGSVMDLPQGATPLDFAYHVHTEVGHRCRGAKINGRIVPLSYELNNGDRVDVLTAKNGEPSRDWLAFDLGYLKTSRARAKVRQWFKQQALDSHLATGRAELEREFQRLGINAKQLDLLSIAKGFNYTKVEDLYAAIGAGDMTVAQVVHRIQALVLPAPEAADELKVSKRKSAKESAVEGGEFTVRGVGNLLTHLANCCKPVPNDAIVGFITVGRGVTIHRRDCPNALGLANSHPGRMIEVEWGGETESTYDVDLLIDAYDRTGLLRDIANVIANEKANVLAVNTQTDSGTCMARMAILVQINDIGQLSRLLSKIAQLPNVLDARRKA